MTEPMNPAQIAAMVANLRAFNTDASRNESADALEAQAAEIARLTEQGGVAANVIAQLATERDAAEAKVAALTAALRFYADSETYETQYERMPYECCTNIFEPINEDKGASARAALGGSI
jgi:hypothetical protein